MNSINIGGILLTEVNRIKEMMGVNLINEGWDDILKQLTGVSDDAVTGIAKDAGDNISSYSSKLASIVGGTGSISDITTYLSKQGLGTSDDAIVNWIRKQPGVLDQIARNSDDIMKNASQIVFNRLKVTNIIDNNSKDIIDDLLSTPFSKNYVGPTIDAIDQALSTLKSTRSKGTNPDIEVLIKQLEDKKKLSVNYKNSVDLPTEGSSRSLDDDLAKAQKQANESAEITKNIKKVKEYIKTGQWGELGWKPIFMNRWKKEVIAYFNLTVTKLENGTITPEQFGKEVKQQLSEVVKKKSTSKLTPKEKKGFWILESLTKNPHWYTTPAAIFSMIFVGYLLYSANILTVVDEVGDNYEEKSDEIDKLETFTVDDCQKYFDEHTLDAIATSVDVIDDNNCKCKWETKDKYGNVLGNGIADFTLENNTWVSK